MEHDASVRELVELVYGKQFDIVEMAMANASIPSYLLTNDFPRRLQGVLSMKRMIFNNEWRRDIHGCSHMMLSSFDIYLNCVMFACLAEYKCYQNVFESFISVCALLKCFNDEILAMTGMDIRDLNADLFMVLYNNVMKTAFYEQGGLQKFVEYIHVHKYLSWKWSRKNLFSTDGKISDKIQKDIKKKAEKEFNGRNFPETDIDSFEMDVTTIMLVQKVLSAKSIKLLDKPNNLHIVKSLEALRNEERIAKAIEVFVDFDETREGCSSSNFDSKTDCTINHNDYNVQNENIIQAIIRHNHSRSSGCTISDNPCSEGSRGNSGPFNGTL